MLHNSRMMWFLATILMISACRNAGHSDAPVPEEKGPTKVPQVPKAPKQDDNKGPSKDGLDQNPSLVDTSFDGVSVDAHAMGDMNGDGRSDLVYFTDLGVAVSISTGASFLKAKFWSLDFGWGDADLFPRAVADVNGDGKADIVGFKAGATHLAFSTGTELSAPVEVLKDFGRDEQESSWLTQDMHPRFLADVNADGRADIVGCLNQGCYVSLGRDDGFARPSRAAWIEDFSYAADGKTSSKGWISMNYYPRFLQDVNGDRRADLVGIGERGLWFSESTGDYFKEKERHGLINSFYASKNYSWRTQNVSPRIMGDIDGDGKADLLGFDRVGEVYVSYGKDQLKNYKELTHNRLDRLIDLHRLESTSLRSIPRFLSDVDGDGQDELVLIMDRDDFSGGMVEVINFPLNH